MENFTRLLHTFLTACVGLLTDNQQKCTKTRTLQQLDKGMCVVRQEGHPNKLNAAIVYGLGLITLKFLVCMMIEILLFGCFLRHTIQFNVLCVNVSSLNLCCFAINRLHFLAPVSRIVCIWKENFWQRK